MQRIFGGIFNFLYLFLVAHWSHARMVNERAIANWKTGKKATFYQFNESMYLWPLIPGGFYTLILNHFQLVDSQLLGWLYMTVVLIVITTITVDLKRGFMAALIFFGGFVLVALAYAERVWGWSISTEIDQFLRSLHMGYHSDWAILITATATLIYTANYVWRRYDSTMTVEGDQLTLHRLAADSLTYQRGNWMFRARFKDILEWLFGGGSGSLAIVHPVTGAELFVANHVPGFRRIAEKIQRQFSTTDVTHSAHVERPEEVAVH